MYTIHNRDDLEKLKKLNHINQQLKEQRLKKKLGRQDFHHDVKELFEPVTHQQTKINANIKEQTKQIEEGQKQFKKDALENTQKITGAINQNTKSIQQSNKKFIQAINQGIENYDAITKQSTKTINNLVNQNIINISIAQTLSSLFTNKNLQFRIEIQWKMILIIIFYINFYYKVPIIIKGH